MSPTSSSRLSTTWLALSAITVVSWWIGSHHGHDAFVHNPAVTIGVILMAAIKVRVIVGEFMEVRHATPTVQRVVDVWIAALVVLLLVLYFYGARIEFLSALVRN
jgi:hypothetical protein